MAVLSSRLMAFAVLLRFKPFDDSTTQGRANERHRRVLLSAGASAAAKLISVATALISVPLTLHYLGPERYGMWMTMSSVIAMLTFADLGMGNGLLSAVAESHGRDDRVAIQRYVASGFFILSIIAISLLLLFTVAYPFVPWHRLFNVESLQAKLESGSALAVFVFCFALNIPLSIVQRVQMGLQQGFSASLWQCGGSLLALCGVLLAIHMQTGLPWLIGAMVGAPLVTALCNSLYFFGFRQRDLAPTTRSVSRIAMQKIARTGGLFFVLQIVMAIAYSSDNIVIAQMLGAASVTEYAVPEKMFSLISVVVAMLLTPLWPAYSEAIARGDGLWVRQTLKRSFTIAIGFAALLSTCLVIFGEKIISLWVGHAVMPPLLLLIGLALWKIIESGGNSLSMFLNGANLLHMQTAMAALVGISAITLKIFFVNRYGISGVVFATILSYLLFTFIPLFFLLPNILQKK